jgi:hypothetical protein
VPKKKARFAKKRADFKLAFSQAAAAGAGFLPVLTCSFFRLT